MPRSAREKTLSCPCPTAKVNISFLPYYQLYLTIFVASQGVLLVVLALTLESTAKMMDLDKDRKVSFPGRYCHKTSPSFSEPNTVAAFFSTAYEESGIMQPSLSLLLFTMQRLSHEFH